MVSVTEDWNAFEGYAENCRVGTFQIRDHVDGKEVRVQAGRLGFIKVFDMNNEQDRIQYERIAKFCKIKDFVQIVCTMSDEVFYS